MKSLIIILGLMDNGNQVMTTQSFDQPCPPIAVLQQAGNELTAENYAKRVTISCYPLDGKKHSVTIVNAEGKPA